jgi:uncharacterized membrane protein
MLKLYKLLFLAIGVLFTISVNAQDVEEKGFMRSEGKIYVVAAIVITILAGLIFYVARLDRKISKLEKGK